MPEYTLRCEFCGSEYQAANPKRRFCSFRCSTLRIHAEGRTHTTHGLSKTPTYETYIGMVKRCHKSYYSGYSEYGGRGIQVCERWRHSFEAFVEDMGERPEGKTLDRIDGDGDYTPENCRWATPIQQQKNRKITRWLTAFGKTQTIREWSEETGLSRTLIEGRLSKSAWSHEKTLSTPAPIKQRYLIVEPSGIEHIVENATAFCREHGLDRGNLQAVFDGRHRHHKGYTGRFLAEDE